MLFFIPFLCNDDITFTRRDEFYDITVGTDKSYKKVPIEFFKNALTSLTYLFTDKKNKRDIVLEKIFR